MHGLFTTLRRGATSVEGGVAFSLWAPRPDHVELQILTGKRTGTHAMHPNGDGLWGVMLEEATPGDRYVFLVNGRPLPDPCTRFQPEGVHGPSEVVSPTVVPSSSGSFHPAGLRDLVIYEMHVGAFTPEGTLQAAAAHLPALRELGFNCVELMPVAQFSGAESWGYDPVQPYAVAAAYGGPVGLTTFVEAAHQLGIAVILDVTLDHLGADAGYLADFAPYFADTNETSPASLPLNLEGSGGGPVREYALQSAVGWMSDYRADGLRLTSSHFLHHLAQKALWRELAERTSELEEQSGRGLLLIGDGGHNEVRMIQPRSEGGVGLDALWAEDFHHALHALLTPARHGKLIDYGSVDHLKRAVAQGFAFEGEWSRFRGGPHGTYARKEPTERFVIFSRSHESDDGGKPPAGDPSDGRRAERLVLALTLFCPGTPLVFMGQEYGDRAPFLRMDGPDADPAAQERSRLQISLRDREGHRGLLRLTKALIALRSRFAVLRDSDRRKTMVEIDQRRRLLCVRRGDPGQRLLLFCSFAKEAQIWEGYLPEARWEIVLDCADTLFEGKGRATEPLLGGFTAYPLEPLAGRIFREVAS
jgi:maltooligosyltrehalose trehalohydrolase